MSNPKLVAHIQKLYGKNVPVGLRKHLLQEGWDEATIDASIDEVKNGPREPEPSGGVLKILAPLLGLAGLAAGIYLAARFFG